MEQWRKLCSEKPQLPRAGLANLVASQATIKCSVRSLQLWAQKLDAEGPQALSDQYAPAPRKALSLDSKRATDAVSMCAWWAFRIGNVEKIDAAMMHHADQALRRSLYLADVLAAIDCYYAYDTDRVKFPFKTSAKWCRYDVETWIGRANDKEDYRSRLAEDRTPLLGGDTSDHTFAGVPDPEDRRRDVNHRPTRRAIEELRQSEPRQAWSGQSSGQSEPRPEGRGHYCGQSSGPPSSIHESIMALDEPMRIMLFAAARGDTQARSQAVATMPLWWVRLPETVRNNIDVRASSTRPGYGQQVRARKLMMLLKDLQRERRQFNSSPTTIGSSL